MAQQQFYVFFHNGFLSQWHPSKFKDGGLTFDNCEQYMMFSKAKLFGDERSASLIMSNSEPSFVKKVGRSVSGFDERIWEEHREEIVYRGNMLKFSQNVDLRAQLLAYPNPIFVEASPYDRIWGIGYSAANAMANRQRWGLNLLGLILTKIYRYLKV